MKATEVKRFATLYERHLKLLILQGKSNSTIDAYSRAVRRIGSHFDCCPDRLTKKQLEDYYFQLGNYSHPSGSTSGILPASAS